MLFSFARVSWLLVQFLSSGLADQTVLTKTPSPLDEHFAQLVNQTLKEFHVPGVAVGVIDGDEVFTKGYGIAKFPDTPVTPSTLFFGGSTTKAFTAAALSLLVDDNDKFPEVQWNTPISNIIREDFVLADSWATSHVTLEDILSHRTGLPRHDLSYGGSQDTLKDVVRSLRHLPMTAEPRAEYQYCNLMFMTASYVTEVLEEKWLGDVLKERIWAPLGMTSTFLSEKDAQASGIRIASGYAWINESFNKMPNVNLTLITGAGAIMSNVIDYSKWAKSLIDSSGPLSSTAHKAIRTGRIITPEYPWSTGEVSYALGWIKGVYKGYEFIMHGGATDAFGTNIIMFPALKYGVVAFANTADSGNAAIEVLSWNLINDKLNVPENDRYDHVKHFKDRFQREAEDYDNAINIAYPSIPDPPLLPTLPLLNYTGTYFHPAWRNLTLVLQDDALFINRTDAVWKMTIHLTHVSGDHFMGFVNKNTGAPTFRQALPMQFQVGSNGVVKKLGVAGEKSMGEEMLWFSRVA